MRIGCIGLKWAGADRDTLQRLARELKAAQRPDGGWGAFAGRDSDVYATAQALVALREGGVGDIDPGWRRGVEYLLKAQAADGSWRLTSRLNPPAPLSPPYFDAGYPEGHDQFISMTAASWAVMALAYALPPTRPVAPPPLPETLPSGVEPWVETIVFGSVADVRRLLDQGLNPNAATKSGGTTALMAAAPDAEKMKLLLDRGARRQRAGAEPVQRADGGRAVSGLDRGDQPAARSRRRGRRRPQRAARPSSTPTRSSSPPMRAMPPC